MRFFQLIVLIILSTSLFSREIKFPGWYGNLTVKSNEYIGYGKGKTFEEAVIYAKKDIANQIETKVEAETVSSFSEINSKVDEKISTKIKSSSKVSLSGYKIFKQEKVKKMYFVSIKYNLLDLSKEIAAKVVIPKRKIKQNKYLFRTNLMKEINKEVGTSLNFSLMRKDDFWYLGFKQDIFRINDKNFEKLLSNYQSEGNEFFIIPSKRLKHGDIFSFNVKSSLSDFFSIINVYGNGKCFIITENQPIQKGFVKVFPGNDCDFELTTDRVLKVV